MAFGPVVTGSGLTKDKIVWTEHLSERSGPNRVHGAGFQVDQDGTGHIFTARGFIVVDVDAFQLEFGGSGIRSSGVNSMFVGNDFPKLYEIRMERENRLDRMIGIYGQLHYWTMLDEVTGLYSGLIMVEWLLKHLPWHRFGCHIDQPECERFLSL